MHRKTRSRSSLLCALGSALVLSLVFAPVSGGCSLIKINGKPLSEMGGGEKGEGASTASAGDASESEGGASAVAAPVTPIAKASPKSAMCKSVEGDSEGTLAQLEDRLAKQEPEYAASTLLGALCSTEGEYAARRDQVKALGAAWMARNSLDDRDVAYLYARTRRSSLPEQDLKEFAGPIGEYAALTAEEGSTVAALDRITKRDVSELAKLAALDFCRLAELRADKNGPSVLYSVLCTRWVIDPRKAMAEIDATPGVNDATRFELRQKVVHAHATQHAAVSELAKLTKEEPGVAQVIAIADQELKKWASLSPERFQLLGLVREMEKAEASKRRSSFAGCQEKTSQAWREQLRGLKLPPLPENDERDETKYLYVYANATQGTAEGYLAFTAFRICAMSEVADKYVREKSVEWALQTRRGPWSSMLMQWALADKIEFDLEGRTFDKMRSDVFAFVSPGPIDRPSAGVIGGIKEVEGGVKVTFKEVKELRYGCMEWAPTNRVERVNSSGVVEYVQRCVRKGSDFMDLTPSDMTFPTSLVQGLRPGMYLVAIDGLPIVATASKSSKKPVFVLGGSLQ